MPRPDLIPSRGAVAEPLVMAVGRQLTASDLARLGTGPKLGVPILQRLRATHHRQAQLLAEGKTPTQIAAIVGCTVQRLVQLQNDPTFTELVAYYHDQMMTSALGDAQRLAGKLVDVGEMAVDELTARLEDDAKRNAMKTQDLRQIAEMAMDRTVAPPKAAPTTPLAPPNVTINFGTALRNRSSIALDDDNVTLEGTVESK